MKQPAGVTPSEVNSDFSKSVFVDLSASTYIASPMPGVERILLDRVGTEVARATSIVRYAAGSSFSPHVHNGGEEFVVLEGVFQDEHGDYPEGFYVRNPPQSSHQPKSAEGCVIFVKLWQFDLADRTPLTIAIPLQKPSSQSTGKLQVLFKDSFETVSYAFLDANDSIDFSVHNGLEILVLDGEVVVTSETELTQRNPQKNEEITLSKHSWYRGAPLCGCSVSLSRQKINNTRALIWVKTNHLVHVQRQLDGLSQALQKSSL